MKPDMRASIHDLPAGEAFQQIRPKKKFDSQYFSKKEMKLQEDLAFIFEDAEADTMVESTHLKNEPWGRTLEKKGEFKKNGYVAMFWKTLRNPPEGFEDNLIFYHFLRWPKLFRRRCNALKHDTAKTIKQIEEEKQKAMPSENFFHSADHGHDDCERFLITLRHGCSGIDAVIGYMGICTTLFGNITGGRIPYAAVPAALTELFQTIKRKYPTETPATQKNIREFLFRLKESYAATCIDEISTPEKSSEQLRFVIPRGLGLAEGITASFN